MANWIFQGNPKKFNIDKENFPNIHDLNSYIEKDKTIKWSVRQAHLVEDIKKGDQVFIWRSDGGETNTGGAVALAEIVTEPFKSKNIFPEVELLVKEYRLTEQEGMLMRHKLKELPETKNLLILRAPAQTNYKLSDEEFNILNKYWNTPEKLNETDKLSLVDKYLYYYQAEFEQFQIEFDFLRESYNFFQQFREPNFIRSMEWEDFQKIGDHVNAFRMQIAKSRAFGNMNAPLEKYRESFHYLIHGEDSIEFRIDQFLHNEDYSLFGIGVNALSEIIGNTFPEDYCFYNQRDRVALENELEVNPEYSYGDSFGKKFVKFQQALKESNIVERYEEIIGSKIDLPIYYEIDQFFSFIYEKRKTKSMYEDMQTNYWLIASGQYGNYWNDFKNKNEIYIYWPELGDLRNYKNKQAIMEELKEKNDLDYNPTNNALANEQFLREINEGDYVFVKSGTTKLIAYGQITSEYQYNNKEMLSYRSVEWLREGDWDVSDLPIHQKTLTNITSYEEYLQSLLSRVEESQPPYDRGQRIKGEIEVSPYTIDDVSADLFMDLGRIGDAIESLNYKKNIILQGPPGVGKTFIAKRLAYYHMEKKDNGYIEMVQFHQTYSYEEFIQGFKPSKEGHFDLQDGLFYKFCKKAQLNPEEKFYFVIDEINRGNLSKIFGEVMMLMEADKRGPEHAISLIYSDDEKFYIPENVYIIATMNTADRSLSIVDYALRRRFAFINLVPGFDTDAFTKYLIDKDISQGFVREIQTFMKKINKEIVNDSVNLGKGFEIGHSYFTPNENITDEDAWFERVIRLEIEPLLREYWFDQEDKVDGLINQYK